VLSWSRASVAVLVAGALAVSLPVVSASASERRSIAVEPEPTEAPAEVPATDPPAVEAPAEPTPEPEPAPAPEPAPEAAKPAVSAEAQLAFDSAFTLSAGGQNEDALSKVNHALTLVPQWAEAHRLRAGIYNNLAQEYAPGSRFLRAVVTDFETYLSMDPNASDRQQVLEVLVGVRRRLEDAEKKETRWRGSPPHKRGRKLMIVGGGVAGGGAVISAISIIGFSEGNTTLGAAVVSVGGATVLTGLAIVIAGAVMRLRQKRQIARDESTARLLGG
jgi:hypothetical protein